MERDSVRANKPITPTVIVGSDCPSVDPIPGELSRWPHPHHVSSGSLIETYQRKSHLPIRPFLSDNCDNLVISYWTPAFSSNLLPTSMFVHFWHVHFHHCPHYHDLSCNKYHPCHSYWCSHHRCGYDQREILADKYHFDGYNPRYRSRLGLTYG